MMQLTSRTPVAVWFPRVSTTSWRSAKDRLLLAHPSRWESTSLLLPKPCAMDCGNKLTLSSSTRRWMPRSVLIILTRCKFKFNWINFVLYWRCGTCSTKLIACAQCWCVRFKKSRCELICLPTRPSTIPSRWPLCPKCLNWNRRLFIPSFPKWWWMKNLWWEENHFSINSISDSVHCIFFNFTGFFGWAYAERCDAPDWTVPFAIHVLAAGRQVGQFGGQQWTHPQDPPRYNFISSRAVHSKCSLTNCFTGPFGFQRGNQNVRFGDRPQYGNRQGQQGGGNWQRRGGDNRDNRHNNNNWLFFSLKIITARIPWFVARKKIEIHLDWLREFIVYLCFNVSF